MLFLIPRDLAVKVGRKLHGALCGIIDGGKIINQLLEGTKVAVIRPFRRRFREEGGIEFAKLDDLKEKLSKKS